MRALGVDFGERRVGVAVSDPTGLVASPWGILERTSDAGVADRVASLILELSVDLIVLGLPLDTRGEEGPQARRVRRFGELLARRTDAPVVYWDESFSSADAAQLRRLRGARRAERARPVDDIAAAMLLQSYLDTRPATPERT